MGGGGNLLGAAVVLIIAITAWVLGHMFPFFYLMKMLGLLRVDEAEERMGLDVSHHGGSAYEATQGADLIKGKTDESEQALLTRCASLCSVCVCLCICGRVCAGSLWCLWSCCGDLQHLHLKRNRSAEANSTVCHKFLTLL